MASSTASKIETKANKAEPISWASFQKNYLTRDDPYKYEWVKGAIEKTERAIDQYQTTIGLRLTEFFFRLKFQNKVSGGLMAETDTFFLKDVHRRPDMAYWTQAQITLMENKKNQIPKFIIEVISKNDQINKVHEKMKNYWDAEVEVIWHIFPELKIVHVYQNKAMEVLAGKQICSAAPVLPLFELSVDAIFGVEN